MKKLIRCATEANDFMTMEAGVNKKSEPVFTLGVYENGVLKQVFGLSVEDSMKLGHTMTDFIDKPFEEYSIVENYFCKIDDESHMEVENVLDKKDNEVLSLGFRDLTINLDRTTASTVADTIALFLVATEEVTKSLNDNIAKGMMVLHQFIALSEHEKIAVFAKFTGLLYGMDCYNSHSATTNELIEKLNVFLTDTE